MVVADCDDTNQQGGKNTLFTTHSQHAGTHQLTFQPAVKGRHDPPNSQAKKKKKTSSVALYQQLPSQIQHSPMSH